MKIKRALVLGFLLVASDLFFGLRHGFSQPPEDRIPLLNLNFPAVSFSGFGSIRLFETYRNAASYQAHLQSPHFKNYKEADATNREVTQFVGDRGSVAALCIGGREAV